MSRTPSEGRRFFSIATSRTLLASWQGIAWKAGPISRLAKPLIVQRLSHPAEKRIGVIAIDPTHD